MKTRLNWVDIARGIGIITVLYGHAISGDSFRHIIYAFHMPLFFFLSGIVFNPQKNTLFLPFLKKNIMSILVPYLGFALISYIIWLLSLSDLPSLSTVGSHGVHILYGNSQGLFFNVVLWFLPCLFVTKVLFWTLTKYVTKPLHILMILFIVSVVGYGLYLYMPGIKLSFGFETALTALVFYGLGYLWKMHSETLIPKTKWKMYTVGFVSLVVMTLLATFNFDLYGYQVDMRLNKYGNYFLFYFAALSGIVSVIVWSKCLDKNSLLETIGKYSLPLFVWHIIVFTYLTKLTLFFIPQDVFTAYRTYGVAPVFTLVTTLFILVSTFAINALRKKLARHG